MDEIAAILKGPPPGDDMGATVDWLLRMQQALLNSPDAEVHRIADPLKEAAELLAKLRTASEDEQRAASPQVSSLMLQAQVLSLRAYVKGHQKLKDGILQEAKKHKPGSELRTRFDTLAGAYEEALAAVSRAYHEALEGRTGALQSLPAELGRIAQKVPPAQ